jgi:WD40 repeat protein
MTTVAFSPDGQTLASAGGDGIINLWDRADLLQVAAGAPAPAPTQLIGHRERISQMSVSPDGSRLASVSTDHSARVWSVADPDAAPLVLDHAYVVNAASWDPSGRRLATACSDTNAYLWDLEQPSEPLLLSGAAAEIRDVAFSPDGRMVGAVSLDGSLRVWPTEGGEPLVLDAGFGLYELEFADDGRRIAVAGLGPQLPLWYLGPAFDPDALQTRLMHATQLCLSPEQRMRFVGESLASATEGSDACEAGRIARRP